MGECILGGAGGKKTANGTFTISTMAPTYTIPLNFAPKKVCIIFQSPYNAIVSGTSAVICYDFETNFGYIFISTETGSVGWVMNLHDSSGSGYAAYRPTYSNGVLTVYGGGAQFKAGDLYEWFATE